VAEREQTDAARRRLATGRPVLLSELGPLDSAEFGLFLRLLGDALAAGPAGPDGAIRARTADGTMEIVLRPLPCARIAEIRTADGVMRGLDHEITIMDLVPAPPTWSAGSGQPAEPASVTAGAGPERA
jgi:uncharacterized protein (TIGR02677 family)